jgi:hypothetical protein
MALSTAADRHLGRCQGRDRGSQLLHATGSYAPVDRGIGLLLIDATPDDSIMIGFRLLHGWELTLSFLRSRLD